MERTRAEVALAVLAAAAAAIILLAAGSSACTNLATINLSSDSGHPGDSIVLTGTSFPVPRASTGLAATPVEVHWKGADGPLLGKATPDRSGTISLTFTIPESAPGPAVIVATQRRALANPSAPHDPPTFTDEYGTPARATIRVLAPGERATRLVPQFDFVPVTTDGSSTAMMVMLVLCGAVALSLFGGGVIAFLHQVRLRRLVAQPGRR